jgi:hypothetical protein
MKPLKYDHHVHTKIRGHVHTHNPLSQPGRGRRTYGVEFKTQLVAACRIPGVSVVSVAREHGINHKVLHRWMREVGCPNPVRLAYRTPVTKRCPPSSNYPSRCFTKSGLRSPPMTPQNEEDVD